MLKNGQTARMSDFLEGRGDVIMKISSTPTISGHREGFPFSLADSAVIAMIKHIAWEFVDSNIRAYVLPTRNSATETSYNSMSAEERAKAANEPSMKRWGKPEEVARVTACVVSNNISFSTGNTITVDGSTVLH
jgi:NAD(P)-dependent dehydrogenase (short-subunit alcohol dehydrogenase family)